MRPTETRGATNNLSAPANWDEVKYGGKCGDLKVRVDTSHGVIECVSTWRPDAAELALLNAGGGVEIGLFSAQPAMWVQAVPPLSPPIAEHRPTITINEEAHGH